MDLFIDVIKKQILMDKEMFGAQKKVENLYVSELAGMWIDKNVKNKEEYVQKVAAMGKILNDINFKKAIEISSLALSEKNTNEKAIEMANLINNIMGTDSYKENSEISGYKILSKFQNPDVYKKDDFIVHTNIMVRLFEYLKAKEEV